MNLCTRNNLISAPFPFKLDILVAQAAPHTSLLYQEPVQKDWGHFASQTACLI